MQPRVTKAKVSGYSGLRTVTNGYVSGYFGLHAGLQVVSRVVSVEKQRVVKR